MALRVLLASMAIVSGIPIAGCGSTAGSASRVPSAPPGSDGRASWANPAGLAPLEARAAAGLSHVLFADSPGGLPASVHRTEALRGLIVRAAAGGCGGASADALESIVLLESAGDPDALAGDSLSDAAGLTQILASTATGLLGMHVDLRASARLTRAIDAGASPGRIARLRARRARVDSRFDPVLALAGTCRYLTIARERLGRTDLAEESYHMGIGNLQAVLARFGAAGPVPYSALYFGSTPASHPAALALLDSFGDDSATYLWRLRAAQSAIALERHGASALEAEAELQTAADSAELVLHPPCCTPSFLRPTDLDRGERGGALRTLSPPALRAEGVGVSPSLRALGARYLALRPDAAAVLDFLARQARAIDPRARLVLAAAVRDAALESRLATADPSLPSGGASTDSTGYAFALRPPSSPAVRFLLHRLAVLHLVALDTGPFTLRVTVAGGAGAQLGVLPAGVS